MVEKSPKRKIYSPHFQAAVRELGTGLPAASPAQPERSAGRFQCSVLNFFVFKICMFLCICTGKCLPCLWL